MRHATKSNVGSSSMASLSPPRLGTEALDTMPLRLEYARCLRSLSVNALDRKIGQRQYLTRVEGGVLRAPAFDVMLLLASALGVTDAWLQRGTGAAPRFKGTGAGDPKERAIETLRKLRYTDEEMRGYADTIRATATHDFEWWLSSLIVLRRRALVETKKAGPRPRSGR